VATGEINKAIVETFRGRGIVIPFPQHEVRLIGQVV
jgi:small-conductance mechanosensitive channel